MAPGAPRIDYEPIYSSLKAAVGSYWGTYKDALAQFLLGKIYCHVDSPALDGKTAEAQDP